MSEQAKEPWQMTRGEFVELALKSGRIDVANQKAFGIPYYGKPDGTPYSDRELADLYHASHVAVAARLHAHDPELFPKVSREVLESVSFDLLRTSRRML